MFFYNRWIVIFSNQYETLRLKKSHREEIPNEVITSEALIISSFSRYFNSVPLVWSCLKTTTVNLRQNQTATIFDSIWVKIATEKE